MENLISFLFLMAVIVICVLTLNIENFFFGFLGFLAPLAFAILIIAGSIYAVGYALGETWKYRNEVEKEELAEEGEND